MPGEILEFYCGSRDGEWMRRWLRVVDAASVLEGCAGSSAANAQSSDTTYATVSLGWNANSQALKCTGFGFSLLSTSTIDGIQLEVENHCSSSGSCSDQAIRLVKGGTIQSTDKSSG